MLDGDLGPRLADGLAALGRLAEGVPSGPEQLLRRAVELAADSAPGATAASAALWRRVEPAGPAADGAPVCDAEVRAASHPDTAWLDEEELALGAGPTLAALADGTDMHAADLAAEPRWPQFAGSALTVGVRAVHALVRRIPAGGLTLTLYAVRPGAFGGTDTAVGLLVLAQAATTLENAELLGQAQRSAHQLGEALRGRAVIEQAKGVLMYALGCDADTAFAELRRRSQASNLRLAEVAAGVIARRDTPG